MLTGKDAYILVGILFVALRCIHQQVSRVAARSIGRTR